MNGHKSVVSEYLREIRKRYTDGNYTEMTFRTPFENLIEGLDPEYSLFQEPERKRNLGAPDFKAHRKSVKVGYIETKNLEVDLDKEIESEQLTKYKESIDNMIFTNYHRFILIRDRNIVLDTNLFNMTDLGNARFSLGEQEIQKLLTLVESFFEFNRNTITSVEELADELSKKTKLLRDIAAEQLTLDIETPSASRSSLHDFYRGINELITDISIEDCADAYAQTITYGLFLAKLKLKKNTLDRDIASLKIPQSMMFIRKIFNNITGELIPDISWIIDEVIDVLNSSDIEAIISEMDTRGSNDKDPFSFFYEDFLSKYEPQKRKHMGVYYTPRPIVSFIVTSVNLILKHEFGMTKGFAEDDVTVLDPAAGTATFLWLVYHQSVRELKDKGLTGVIKQKIENHILKNLFGFEIQITPYIFAHLKLSSALDKFGYELKDKDRSQVYLTNTLEPAESHGLIPFMRELNDESSTANLIKKDKKILAIIGNPPYSSISVNNSTWIEDLLKKGYNRADGTTDSGYYQVDGQPLGERNPKWLQDDYVKFIRFAQWKIDTAGEGIVGYVTNHSYLDNVTFRGMRKSLIDSFDTIYLLNLHGNIIKKETTPRGSVDENVFENIKQGVVISIFVKSRRSSAKKIFYADLWGKRLDKFQWLDRRVAVYAKSFSPATLDVEWEELHPEPPYYFFVPKDLSLQKDYEKYWKITDIFPFNNNSIVTARDSLTIKWTPTEVMNTITEFAKLDTESAREKFQLGKDGQDWKVHLAQEDLKKTGLDNQKIVPIHYRPFDVRYTYYTGNSRGFHGRPRSDIMPHMLKENIGLITRRQMLPPFNYVFVSNMIISDGIIRSDNKGGESLFPLYTYSNDEDNRKEPNINPNLLKFLHATYSKDASPEDIFNYVYAILSSTIYRARYSEFLKSDFPRIPFVRDYTAFKTISGLGKELVSLHTMKTKCDTKTSFNIQGTNKVDFIKYDNGKIKINETQFFAGITETLWNFSIGAYKVLEKWLKSRKGRELTSNEIEHFLQIVEIIKNTIERMNKIDRIVSSTKFN